MPARERRLLSPLPRVVRSGLLQVIGSFPVAGGAQLHVGNGTQDPHTTSGLEDMHVADGHVPARSISAGAYAEPQ